MKNLIIIGARGWDREIMWGFKKDYVHEYMIKGFLDDNAHALDDVRGEFPPIISSVEEYAIQKNDIFFCAMGDPMYRKKYANIIKAKGGHFATYISPDAMVYPNAHIGERSSIGANSVVSENVTIGEQTMIHGMCILGHDVIIGNYVSVEAYCFFGGYASVGDYTSVHVRSTIISHKRIGSAASIGAGSVVIRNVKDNTHVFGNPATRID